MLNAVSGRAFPLLLLLIAGACGGGSKPGKLLARPQLIGDTELRVREVQPPTPPGESRPNRLSGFYTADSDKEVIPPRFATVLFMNESVAFGNDGGGNYSRIQYDVTGRKSARITETPYTEVGTFDLGRRSQTATEIPQVWYGKDHRQRLLADTAIFDEEGNDARTIPNVHWKYPHAPKQQGEALVFSVGATIEKPLFLITDLHGTQTVPVMPNIER